MISSLLDHNALPCRHAWQLWVVNKGRKTQSAHGGSAAACRLPQCELPRLMHTARQQRTVCRRRCFLACVLLRVSAPFIWQRLNRPQIVARQVLELPSDRSFARANMSESSSATSSAVIASVVGAVALCIGGAFAFLRSSPASSGTTDRSSQPRKQGTATNNV